MIKFGLIGYPLSHSFSQKYFTEKFQNAGDKDRSYENFPIADINLFPFLVENDLELIGLNVTIPYKESVMPFLHQIDAKAKEVGAVNTVKIERREKVLILTGYNTDIYGFENALKPLLEDHHKKALILGTGGASKAIKYVLRQLNIEYVSASIEELKENEISYSAIDEKLMTDCKIIINATPLGTYPNVDSCPDIPYQYIGVNHLLFDLVYNPETTLFLQKGRFQGAKIKNGLEMLHLQAEKAYLIWNSNELQ